MKSIDFHAVEPHQAEIDRRLANWGKWCNGRSAPSVSPMFRMVPPNHRIKEDARVADKVDGLDAQRIAKGVAALPALWRQALAWAYIKPVNPNKAAREMGLNLKGEPAMLHLSRLLRDARQALLNRGV